MKRGDSAKCEELLHRHGPGMVLFARQWVDCHADAEDVVHNAFIRFWKARKGVDDAGAYLFTCVKSCALQWRRAESRRKRREQVAAGGRAQAMFESSVIDDERRTVIERALEELSDEQREVVVLKLWSGLTFEQIGKVAGVSQHTAASRYRYALKALRGKLCKELLA